MKLAEMKNDELMDIFGDLCYDVADICEDKKLSQIFSDVYTAEESKNVSRMALQMKGFANGSKALGYILKEKKDTLHHILALVNREDIDTVKNWNPITTINKTKELFGDKDFLALLPSQFRTKIEAFQNISTKSESDLTAPIS